MQFCLCKLADHQSLGGLNSYRRLGSNKHVDFALIVCWYFTRNSRVSVSASFTKSKQETEHFENVVRCGTERGSKTTPLALQAHIQVPGHLASLPALHPMEGLPLGHGPCSCAHCLLAARSGGDWCADRRALRHSALRCAHWILDTLGSVSWARRFLCAEIGTMS